MLGDKTSQHCEPDQTLFARGAYTESDNAPARKLGSGYARLMYFFAHAFVRDTFMFRLAPTIHCILTSESSSLAVRLFTNHRC